MMLYGPSFSQPNCKKARPYQLSLNKSCTFLMHGEIPPLDVFIRVYVGISKSKTYQITVFPGFDTTLVRLLPILWNFLTIAPERGKRW